ncbi:hypothetical protein [Streptomyces sp. NPDC046832]|uniref:hypothetical protein n=1 Tax=Streptomyces sp. NPDC046832 TaxID=3155020 RepID=UPI00340C8783
MSRTSHAEPAAAVAAAHGAFNVVGGLWPLVHLRSFEWVFGPKADEWLQATTGGLLAGAGVAQLAAAADPEGPKHARRIGLATAITLLAVDLVYPQEASGRHTFWTPRWRRGGSPSVFVAPPNQRPGNRME